MTTRDDLAEVMTAHPAWPQCQDVQNRAGLSARLRGALDERASPGSTSIAATMAPTNHDERKHPHVQARILRHPRIRRDCPYPLPLQPSSTHRRDRIEISGQGGWDADFTLSTTSVEGEIVKACDNVEKTLAEAGASWRDVVNVHSYHVPTSDDSIGDQHMSVMVDQFRKRFGESLPVWTALGVKALALPDQHVEIEVVAIAGSGSK
jgi:enamine deaminase RidA (YjgF/YER057c/UK114 family)